MNVGTLTLEMAANVARLQADMAKATSTVEGAAAKMRAAANNAAKALGAIGAGLTVAAFTGFIRGAINAADETSKLSQKIGVTVKDVAGLQLAFRQAGVSQEAMATGLARLSKGIAEGNDGLKSLGISTKNNDGTLKTSRQVLAEVADQFAKTGDGATKTARAQEIFGKTGADLIPLLNAGSKALDEYDALASKLGLTLSDETVKQAEQFNDTLDLVGQSVQGVGRQVAAQLLPTLTGLAGELLNTATSGDRVAKTAEFIASGLKVAYISALAVIEVFNTLGKTIGGVAAAIVATFSGNFGEAKTIISELQKDVASGLKDTAAQIERAWKTTGNSTVEALAKTNKAQMAATAELEKAKKAAQEYAKFLDQIRGKVAELSGVNADYIKQLVEFDKARKNNVITETQYIALVEQLIAKQPSSIKLAKEQADAEKDRVQALESLFEANAKIVQQYEASAETLGDQNKALREEIELIGLTERAQLAILQARNETIILTKEATLAELERASAITGTQTRIEIALQEEIRLLRERGELLGQKLDRTESAKTYENLQAEGKRFTDDLERGLTDSLFRAFEAGRGFFSTLWNGIKNLFKTTVLKLAIQGVVGSVLGSVGLSSAAQTVASTGGSGLSALSNLGSLASTVSGFGAAFGTSFGANLSASFASGFSTVGLSLEAGFASIAQGTVTGIASGLGSLAAVAAPAAAALVVANALGFFRSNKIVDGGISGTLGGQVNDYALNRRGGTLFSGPSYSVQDRGVSAQNDALQKAYSAIRTTVAGMAVQLGIGNDAIKDFTVQLGNDLIHPDTGGFGIKTQGLSQDEIVKKIEAALVSANEQLAAFALGTIEFTRDGETAVETLARLSGSLGSVNGVFKSLGLTLADASLAGADAASKFVESFGGAEQFAQVAQSYYENFYTEQERTAKTIEALRQRFFELGTAGATTREGFRDLVEEQQRLHGATSPVVAELLKLSDTFASVVPAVEAVNGAVVEQQQLAAVQASERADRLRVERELAASAKAAAEEVAKLNEQNYRLALSSGNAAQAAALRAGNGPRFADFQSGGAFNAAGYNAALLSNQQRGAEQALSDLRRQNPFEVADYFGAVRELEQTIASLNSSLDSGEFSGGVSSSQRTAEFVFGDFLSPEEIRQAADGLTSFSSVLAVASGTAQAGIRGVDSAFRALTGGASGAFKESEQFRGGLEVLASSLGIAGAGIDEISAAIDAGLAYERTGEYAQSLYQESLRQQTQMTAEAFRNLTTRAATFNTEAENLETSFDVLSGFIGRLKSVQDAFANAAGDRASEAGLISGAAARLSSIITTPVAEAARSALADLPAFAGLSASALRDVSLLLKDIGQFDNTGLEATFIRLSDALASGKITGQQYADLINYSEQVYLGASLGVAKLTDNLAGLQSSLAKSVAQQQAAIEKTSSDQIAAIQLASEARVSSLQAEAGRVSETIGALRSLFGQLESAQRSATVATTSATLALQNQSQTVLRSALASANVGGSLLNFPGLQDAISGATAQSPEFFRTFDEFVAFQDVSASLLGDLKDRTGAQLSVAELTLRSLEAAQVSERALAEQQIKEVQADAASQAEKLQGLLDTAQMAIDLANGTFQATLSVEDAVRALDDGLQAAIASASATNAVGFAALQTSIVAAQPIFAQPAFQPAASGTGSSTQSLEAQIAVLNARVAELVAINKETMKSSKQTSTAVTGAFGPDGSTPQLVEMVTP